MVDIIIILIVIILLIVNNFCVAKTSFHVNFANHVGVIGPKKMKNGSISMFMITCRGFGKLFFRVAINVNVI